MKHLLVAGCLLAAFSELPAIHAQYAPPNIVILLADDLGYGDLSCHGGKEIATPRIDSLASAGIRCTSGYVSCPYCSPTRAGLLSGRYQQRFGHEFNPQLLRLGGAGQGLHVQETTLADRLKSAGYATGLVGKWHLGEEERFHPQARGFQEFFGFLAGSHTYLRGDDPARGPIFRGRTSVEIDGYLTDVLAREAAAFINRHQKSPFFLYLAFNAVHTPMEAPESRRRGLLGVPDSTRRTYLAMLAALDDAVGVVLDQLRAAGLEERTLVFFLSDNGGPRGKFAPNGSDNGPLRGHKGDTWEGGIRVPFLVHWKGRLPAGRVYDQPVIQLDLHATALAAAGVPIRPEWGLDGVNLIPFLEGKTAGAPHEALYWRFGDQMAIRKGDWKLVRADRSPNQPFGDVMPTPMLVNLAADLGEKADLSASHPEKVKELTELWQTWNRSLKPAAWPHGNVPLPGAEKKKADR